jgi:hypothetical protein
MKSEKRGRGAVMGKLAILLLLAMAAAVGCKDGDDDDGGDGSVTRTFTIVITGHEDHPVTVIDTRTGKNDTDLQKLGVIARLETAWNTKSGNDFEKVIGRGLVIVVEETTAYNRFKAYSGNRLGVNFTYISTDDEYISDRLDGPILSMSEMDTLG